MISSALLDAVLERSTGKDSMIHGPTHWAGVAVAGLNLLDLTPDADPFVVLLFALLHDSMRRSDWRDPEHGARAARYARELRDSGAYSLDEEGMRKLEDALVRHDKGATSKDPTMGACWDADRLNLPRAGIKPRAEYMSTTAGRSLIGTNRAKYFPLFRFDWEAVFREYAARAEGESEAVYLRFGDLPEGGISRFASYTMPEDGVSVYWGRKTGPGSYRIDTRRLLVGVETRFLRLLLSQERPLYVVEGSRVGFGGGGEAVLGDARIVGEVGPTDRLEVLPQHPVIEECVEWWRSKRGGSDPGPFPQTLTPLPPKLPFDRPANLRDTYAAAGDFGWLAKEFNRQFRGHLERWGMLEDYDRMTAASSRAVPRPRAPTVPKASAPWTPPPEPEWLKRHREFEEQQKAMEAKYGRMGG